MVPVAGGPVLGATSRDVDSSWRGGKRGGRCFLVIFRVQECDVYLMKTTCPPVSDKLLQNLGGMMVFVGAWSLAFLTFNTAIALCRAPDASTAAFVATAYLLLLLFFRSLRALEQVRGAVKTRQKLWTWMLATALNVLFSHHVSGVMPPVVAAAAWVVAAVTTLGCFFILFVHDKTSACI